ncbi:unnamed protein product [Amoebophrya sp. A25]|nr:unnamed protein product [Amoebophrya sp. A25]|eukprot:GSA25T00005662001.1
MDFIQNANTADQLAEVVLGVKQVMQHVEERTPRTQALGDWLWDLEDDLRDQAVPATCTIGQLRSVYAALTSKGNHAAEAGMIGAGASLHSEDPEPAGHQSENIATEATRSPPPDNQQHPRADGSSGASSRAIPVRKNDKRRQQADHASPTQAKRSRFNHPRENGT